MVCECVESHCHDVSMCGVSLPWCINVWSLIAIVHHCVESHGFGVMSVHYPVMVSFITVVGYLSLP